MNSTLLQPGQIWKPSNPEVASRYICDLPEGTVLYRVVGTEEEAETEDEYLTSQSHFRQWIKDSEAMPALTERAKASPVAELAKKIVSLRKAHGMTQMEMATALGISRSAVTFMETGRSSSASKHIPRLAEIFQVPVDLFLTGMIEHNDTMTVSVDEGDLIALYRQLPSELKLAAQKYIERLTRKVRLGS